MSLWFKRTAYLLLVLILCPLLLIGLLRSEAIQYVAALSHGFANPLPEKPTPNNTNSCNSKPMNVLTYNVRYGSEFLENLGKRFDKQDPGDYLPWSERYPEIKARILSYSPDLIGLQEMQTDNDIKNIVDLSQYSLFSYHLGDFQYGDSALLFKKDKFSLLDHGQLWLSPHPKLPLSLGFKSFAMIRYVNWVLLSEKSTGFNFLFLNTHFDNNPLNKEKSSDLFNAEFTKLTANYPMIVTGDFNSKATTERYQRLLGNNATAHLVNSYDLAKHANPSTLIGPDKLIDHILVGGSCSIAANQWQIDQRPLSSGQALSDHDPINVTIRFSDQAN